MTNQNSNSLNCRKDFPILQEKIRNRPLAYLDNAASTQKPLSVITAMNEFYLYHYSNIHRGVHYLSEYATEQYEQTREKTARFINAQSPNEIVFTKGSTDAINLVAQSYGRSILKTGDEIIISTLEHHANILPWQIVCQQTGAILKVVPINDAGELLMEAYEQLLNERTKIVAMVQTSNSLGTINPIKEIIQRARYYGAVTLIDGAQAIAHQKINVQDLDCDFYVFSAHKLFGPTGVGVLYGKSHYLEEMPPYQVGGGMIKEVTFANSTFRESPYKFEAGTPNISGVIGMGTAIDYLNGLDFNTLMAHEEWLLEFTTQQLRTIRGITLLGPLTKKAPIISFMLEGIHPHDVGTILDNEGIAVRVGHHCNMPLMTRLAIPGTIRISLAFYNNQQDIEQLISGILQVNKVFN